MARSSTPSESGKEKDQLDVTNMDIERHAVAEAHLKNTTIRHLAWRGITVTVKDRETKLPKTILENVEGIVEAGRSPNLHFPPFAQSKNMLTLPGEICALMGPSGC